MPASEGLGDQVAINHFGIGVLRAPFGNGLGGKLAADGRGAQDAGIDVKQFHDDPPWLAKPGGPAFEGLR